MSADVFLTSNPSTRRPRRPGSSEPVPLSEQPGYYPGFSTLSQQAFWDKATRKKVLDRVHNVPSILFFTEDEARLLGVMADHILPQDDRHLSRRIPIVPRIDERLHKGLIPGYRFAKMPADGDAYRRGFKAIEQMAKENYGKTFIELAWSEQEDLLKSLHDAQPKSGADDIWSTMEVQRYWALVVQDCVEAYYAHPWAWDEIGFGGPAYPRGYMRLEHGDPEPWEVAEQRYEWEAPVDCVSDPSVDEIAAHKSQAAAGQGGTH